MINCNAYACWTLDVVALISIERLFESALVSAFSPKASENFHMKSDFALIILHLRLAHHEGTFVASFISYTLRSFFSLARNLGAGVNVVR